MPTRTLSRSNSSDFNSHEVSHSVHKEKKVGGGSGAVGELLSMQSTFFFSLLFLQCQFSG